MRKRLLTFLTLVLLTESLSAQTPAGLSYQTVKDNPSMKWVCPEIDKYQKLLYSLRNQNYKVYADNVKSQIQLVSDPSDPSYKYLVTQAILKIENPLYDQQNLRDYLISWLKNNSEYGKIIEIDKENNSISATATINVAVHSGFIDIYKAYIYPSLVIKLVETDKLLVSFVVSKYKIDECSDNRVSRTHTERISEVYPFNPKSSHKNTYATAYVKTYQYFWDFISNLCNSLNTDFLRDSKMLAQLHYQYSRDSLVAKYGDPTKVIDGLSKTVDIHNEMYFFEEAKKIVFMGKTLDFKDVMSCEIVDDPTFIPGRSTTTGAGLFFFGIGLGGAETRRTADRTIHNYVVDVKMDNLRIPLIRVATGQNEYKATEIATVFEYILRHQDSTKSSFVPRTRTATRRKK